jgi:hypothetical protein
VSSPTRISPVYVSAGTPGGAGPSGDHCPGCGAPAVGRFCANCGQRIDPPPLSMRLLMRGYLDDSFSLNATLPRTLAALFFRPGYLTREYLRHRISPFVPPFRLYLVTSLVFFLIVSFQTRSTEVVGTTQAEMDSIQAAVRDTIAAMEARGEEVPAERVGVFVDPTDENWADNAEINLGNETLDRLVQARLSELGKLPPREAFRRILTGFIENAPKVMFLLLPLYALLLKVLYIRSKRFYVEHCVFSLHGHAFAFSLIVVLIIANKVPIEGGEWLGLLTASLILWLMIYYWVALKRVYQQGWFKTTVKWLVLGQVYAVVVGVCLAVAFLAAVFTV